MMMVEEPEERECGRQSSNRKIQEQYWNYLLYKQSNIDFGSLRATHTLTPSFVFPFLYLVAAVRE